MMKTILKFLIALIVPGTLTVLYVFSETHILKLLSSDSNGEPSKTLLRSGLGVLSAIIFALSYFLIEYRDKYILLKSTSNLPKTELMIYQNYLYDKNFHLYCPACFTMLVPTREQGLGERENMSLFKCPNHPDALIFIKIDRGQLSSVEHFIKILEQDYTSNYPKNKLIVKS